jgi:DNA-binding GntR family transcriptional regulator
MIYRPGTRYDLSMAAPAPTSLVELAYNTIRERITSGVYGPGYRLVLDELAREIGSSTVPVREAVRRLEAEGYIEYQRHVGARVASFDEAEFVQTVQAVALLEGYATALAAPHMRRNDIAQARGINVQLGEQLDDLNPVQFSTLNREFHYVIYERCPNTHIRSLLANQWARLDTIRRSVFVFVPGRARSSVAEHAQILDLISAGASAEEIEQVAREHKLHTASAVSDGRDAPARGRSARPRR